jgi:hypothetical protein
MKKINTNLRERVDFLLIIFNYPPTERSEKQKDIMKTNYHPPKIKEIKNVRKTIF